MAIVMVNNYPHSMSKDKDFSNFRDFWPYYLSEHFPEKKRGWGFGQRSGLGSAK